MMLNYNYWVFKRAVPVKVCKKILKECRKKIKKKAIVGKGREVNLAIRDCEVAWINEKWIYDIINPFIHIANKSAGWNFEWDWNETSQFTIYKKGHYYGWHADQSNTPIPDENKNLKGKTRKLSLTLQLTDQREYEGGDFQFKWIQEKQDLLKIITVDDAKDIGTVIIFPSFLQHQVLPITKGKRESLVNWSIGKPFR
mgnify:FL=1